MLFITAAGSLCSGGAESVLPPPSPQPLSSAPHGGAGPSAGPPPALTATPRGEAAAQGMGPARLQRLGWFLPSLPPPGAELLGGRAFSARLGLVPLPGSRFRRIRVPERRVLRAADAVVPRIEPRGRALALPRGVRLRKGPRRAFPA